MNHGSKVTKDFLVDTFNAIGFVAIDEGDGVSDTKIFVEVADDFRSKIRTWITDDRINKTEVGEVAHKAVG